MNNATANPTTLTLGSEIGEAGTVRVHVRTSDDKNISLDLPTEQAALLGRSLLACSVVGQLTPRPAVGTAINDCMFPVVNWTTAYISQTAQPVLRLEIGVGLTLGFQLSPQFAKDMAAALIKAGSLTDPAKGSTGNA